MANTARKPPAAGRGRPKGALNKATREIKAFTEQFLGSQAYIAAAEQRVMDGKAPHLEILWHHYAYGKPKDTVLLETAPPLLMVDTLTPSDVQAMKAARDDE